MFCPCIKGECRTDCQFLFHGNCLIFQFLLANIKSFEMAEAMMKPMMAILKQVYGLPDEVKEQLPENLKRQLEDIFRNMGEGA